MKMIRKKMMCLLAFFFLGAFFRLEPIQAGELNLDDKLTYDIHFRNGMECGSVIRNVKVIRYQNIGGKTFLVIEPEGFKLNNNQGYILFDSITAILPSNNYRLVNGIKVSEK